MLNQNQPTLDQLNQLFDAQEKSFENIKIQLFNESSTIHEELKEIKENITRDTPLETYLRELDKKMESKLQSSENRLIFLQASGNDVPSEIKNDLKKIQSSIRKINNPDTLLDKNTFQITIEDKAENLINQFKNYIQEMEFTMKFDSLSDLIQNVIGNFESFQSNLSFIPTTQDIINLFTHMADKEFISIKFNEQESFITNQFLDNGVHFSNTNPY
jgi:hypothetical protein